MGVVLHSNATQGFAVIDHMVVPWCVMFLFQLFDIFDEHFAVSAWDEQLMWPQGVSSPALEAWIEVTQCEQWGVSQGSCLLYVDLLLDVNDIEVGLLTNRG